MTQMPPRSSRSSVAVFAVALAAQAPDRRKPPAIGPGADAQAAGDPEAAALERPAGVDRRAARGAGRAGQPRGSGRQRGRSGGPVRHRQPHGLDAHRRAPAVAIALDIADAIDFLGAEPRRAAPASTRPTIRLQVPVARLADALPIMADVALRPTFPPEELERLRQQRLVSLLQARDDPASVAALAFSRVLYGASHRFGMAAMGTAATHESVHCRTISGRSTTSRTGPSVRRCS